MKPEIWGKYGWCFFHLVTFGYPDNPTKKDKERYRIYITYLKYVLPCDMCKNNLKKHLKKYPLTNNALLSKSNLIKWGIDMHNIVNYYTGKSMLSYNDAMNELNKIINPPVYHNNNNTSTITFIIFILIILFVLWAIFQYQKKN